MPWPPSPRAPGRPATALTARGRRRSTVAGELGHREHLDDAAGVAHPAVGRRAGGRRRSRTEPRCRTGAGARTRSCAELEAAVAGVARPRTRGDGPSTSVRSAADLGRRRPRRRSARLVARRRSAAPRRRPAAAGHTIVAPVVAAVDPAELAVQAPRRPLREHVLGGDRRAGVLAAALEGARADERRLPRPLPRVDERLGRVGVGRVGRPGRRSPSRGGDGDGDQRGGVQADDAPTRGSGRRRARMDGDGTRCSPPWRFTTLPSRSATWPRPTASTRR